MDGSPAITSSVDIRAFVSSGTCVDSRVCLQ